MVFLSSVACNVTLRVAGSTAELIALSVPLKFAAGNASVVTLTARPACDFARSLLRQREIDKTGSSDCNETTCCPADHLPEVDLTDASCHRMAREFPSS